MIVQIYFTRISVYTAHMNGTHTQTLHYLYVYSCTNTVLLYKTCTDELCFCGQNSFKWGTHTDILLFIYQPCTDILHHCTQLLCRQLCTALKLAPTYYTCGAHTMLGSVVLLYIYTVVQSLYVCTVNLF